MLGEDEQELVVHSDGLVDGGPDAGTYGEVVGGNPDSHSLSL